MLDHRLGHDAVAAGPPEIAERLAHEVAGSPHVADVAHRDVQLAFDRARDDRPLGAFNLQEQVGELGGQLAVGHRAEVGEQHAVDESAACDCFGQEIEHGGRQLRPLDAPQRPVIGEAVEEREGLHVGASGAALEGQRVGLDAVEEGGRQSRAHLGVDGAQVFRQDR